MLLYTASEEEAYNAMTEAIPKLRKWLMRYKKSLVSSCKGLSEWCRHWLKLTSSGHMYSIKMELLSVKKKKGITVFCLKMFLYGIPNYKLIFIYVFLMLFTGLKYLFYWFWHKFWSEKCQSYWGKDLPQLNHNYT